MVIARRPGNLDRGIASESNPLLSLRHFLHIHAARAAYAACNEADNENPSPRSHLG
jgi:hypothetical protein